MCMVSVILGDPGAVSGDGEKSKRAKKNSGEEKSRTRRRAPGDKVLTDQFQTAGVILASDWCQKTFVFSAQSQSSKTRSRFVPSYTNHTYRPVARHICLGRSPRVYSRRKVPITAQYVRLFFAISARNSPEIRWTFRRYRINIIVF